MSNPLDAMLGDAPAMADEVVSTPVAEAIPPQAPEAAAEAPQSPPERPRGPDGKFARAETETPLTATPAPPAEPAAKDPLPGISAMLDEREKRQAAQTREQAAVARADALAKQLAELQTPREPPTESESLQQALYAQNLRSSRRFAEREYGKDTIAEVHTWAAAKCDEDPHFNSMMRSSDDPYEAAYQAFNRDKIAAEVSPDDFAQFRAWKAAQAGLTAQQPYIAPPQSPAPAPPPRSLAHAPGNGALGRDSPVEVAPGAAFASAIK